MWKGRNRKKRRKGRQEGRIPVLKEFSRAVPERQMLGCHGIIANKRRHECRGPAWGVADAWHHSGLGGSRERIQADR